MNSKLRAITLSVVAAALSGCAALPAQTGQLAPPIVFVHGNGDTAALWQTTVWRFESNGWPRERLHAINVPYPLSRDDDSKAQPGRTSAAENSAYLKGEVEKVLKATGAEKVILIGNSRGGYAIRSYIDGGGAQYVSHAILGGTPNHGVWSVKGFREASEFSGTGAYLSALNAPKNAAGDEVLGPVRWMTIRSDANDKFAQPDGIWIGAAGTPTNISSTGPELKGATNVVIAGVDHRETAFSAPAFVAAYHFITGSAPDADITPEAARNLSGTVTGLGLQSSDPKSGNFTNNLPLPGAQLSIYATNPATGERIGAPAYRATVAADGRWGPFAAQPGVPYEFVIVAPGYASTHIYRSPFPRSSSIVHLRGERIADADKDAKAIVTLNRPRGYFDTRRDKMTLDGKPLAGVPASGAGVSASKLVLKEEAERAVAGEFNGERIVGRSWPAAQGHIVFLELTK